MQRLRNLEVAIEGSEYPDTVEGKRSIEQRIADLEHQFGIEHDS